MVDILKRLQTECPDAVETSHRHPYYNIYGNRFIKQELLAAAILEIKQLRARVTALEHNEVSVPEHQ